MKKITITLSKGGKGQRIVNLEAVQIPDLWGSWPKLKPNVRDEIIECWHLCHDLKRELLESKEENTALLKAAKKAMGFIDDLAKSNPGYLAKLALQDYAQFNEALIELPLAIAKSEGKL